MTLRDRVRDAAAHMKTAGLPGRRGLVSPDATVSQYGDAARGFREVPRFTNVQPGREPELHVSMALGPKTPDELYRGMTGRLPRASDGPAARHFSARDLLDAGYAVSRTPTRMNPDHVEVGPQVPITLSEAQAWWGAPQRVTLHVLAQVANADEEVPDVRSPAQGVDGAR